MNLIPIDQVSIWNTVTHWFEHHMLPCPSRFFFHFDCPGCGMQRSILALLEGDIEKSIYLYPATIPMLFLVSYALLHIKFNFRYGAAVIKWTQLICAVIIFAFYIYKVITHKIFN